MTVQPNRLPDDRHPLPPREEAPDISDKPQVLAKTLADKVGSGQEASRPINPDATCFDSLRCRFGADGRRAKSSFARVLPGMARLLRLLITAECPRTRLPKPRRALYPEVWAGEAVARHTPHTRPISWRKSRGPRAKSRSKGRRRQIHFVEGYMESRNGAWQRRAWR